MIRPAPGLTIEEQPEPVVLRMLAWGEARNQGGEGIAAVLWVVRNRALKSGRTYKMEALRHLQFSCFNENDPNRDKLLTAWLTDGRGWSNVDHIAELFEGGHLNDPTLGSTHYYVASMTNPPRWGSPEHGWQHRARIGAHEFGVAA